LIEPFCARLTLLPGVCEGIRACEEFTFALISFLSILSLGSVGLILASGQRQFFLRQTTAELSFFSLEPPFATTVFVYGF